MIIKLVQSIINLMSLKKLNILFDFIMCKLEDKGCKFITYHQRPIKSDNVISFSDEIKELPQLGLILQGPVIKENDFTLESIKIYKKHFENTKIILSTWSDEDRAYLKLIEKENIEIVLNDKPEYFGISNINLQIMSSKMGIRKAKELNCDYAIKSRTDQRIYAPNTKEFLFNLIHEFPLNEKTGEIQKKRLVGISLNTFKYRMYGISDMFLFGHINDMLLYWDIEFDNRPLSILESIEKDKSIRNFAECRTCEVYFVTEFLNKMGKNYNFSLKESWQIIADHFCIIDKESLDLYWPKYEKSKEFRYLKYNINTSQELTFREWFNLYSGVGNKLHIPEEILDLEFREVVKGNYVKT